jgi:hypothetical protein
MSGTTKKRKSARGGGLTGAGSDALDLAVGMGPNSALSGLLGLGDAGVNSLLKKRKSGENAGLPASSQGFSQVFFLFFSCGGG